jgi:bacteriorhodopsin
LTSFITTFAAISYFAMAVGEGITWNITKVEEPHKGGIPSTYHYDARQVYWARYVDCTYIPQSF